MLEIVESSKHSVGLVARAMSQPMGTTKEKSPETANADPEEGSNKLGKKQSSPDEAKVAACKEIASDTRKRKEVEDVEEANVSKQQEDTEMNQDRGAADEMKEIEDEDDDDAPIVIGLEEAEEEAKATKKIWNATSRRRGAFRRGLVRCVMVKHEAYLKGLGPDFQEFDPLKEGQWHPGFPIASLSLADVLKAAEEAAEQLASAEQSGRVK